MIDVIQFKEFFSGVSNYARNEPADEDRYMSKIIRSRCKSQNELLLLLI